MEKNARSSKKKKEKKPKFVFIDEDNNSNKNETRHVSSSIKSTPPVASIASSKNVLKSIPLAKPTINKNNYGSGLSGFGQTFDEVESVSVDPPVYDDDEYVHDTGEFEYEYEYEKDEDDNYENDENDENGNVVEYEYQEEDESHSHAHAHAHAHSHSKCGDVACGDAACGDVACGDAACGDGDGNRDRDGDINNNNDETLVIVNEPKVELMDADEEYQRDRNECMDESMSKFTKEQFIKSFNDYYNRWVGKLRKLNNEPLKQLEVANNFLHNPKINTTLQPLNGYVIATSRVQQYLLFILDHETDMMFDEEELKMYKQYIDTMFRIIVQYKQALQLIDNCNSILSGAETPVLAPTNSSTNRLSPSLMDFIRPDCTTNKYNDKQKLHIRLLKLLRLKGYRKYGDYCYEEIKTDSGRPTHAWKQTCKISDFVITCCDRFINPENWDILTKQSKNGVEEMVEKLMTLNDPEFPSLVKTRYKFSFKNGIFVSRIIAKNNAGAIKYVSKFFPYNSPLIMEVDSTTASAKYHDSVFRDFSNEFIPNAELVNGKKQTYGDKGNWYYIPTPTFQKIIDYQYDNLSPSEKDDISRWFYVMIGRLLFDIGSSGNGIEEKWQCMMYILGEPGTGKSTIYENVVQKIYDTREIGILDNNIERQFGLETLLDKDLYILIGQELDQNFKLEKTSFLKIISGEPVVAARKNKSAITHGFKCHMGCCGNKMVGYDDSKGELKRRVVPFIFDHKVSSAKTDTNMDVKLGKELPAIIQKCVLAYLEYGQMYGNQSIWKILPKYFMDASRRIAERTNPKRAFLESNEIVYGPDLYITETEFRNKFMEFCKQRNFPKPKFDIESCKSEFQDISSEKDIKVFVEIRGAHVYPRFGGMMVSNENFIHGLDIKHEEYAIRPPRGDD